MKVHYVDDDDADLVLMIEAARSIPEISLTTSKSIDGLFDRLQSDHLDCILLDINRPDAQTLEDDIDAICKRSNLPIILVTGAIGEDTRLRATLAGADGVIDKSSLSKELLEQILKNARARILAKNTEDFIETKSLAKATGGSIPDWYKQIQDQLYELEVLLAPSSQPEAMSLIFDVREIVCGSKKEEEVDQSISACVPMRWAMNAAIDGTRTLAQQRQIQIESDQITGTFFPKGTRNIGYLGLELLLRGVIESSKSRMLLRCSAASSDEGKTLLSFAISGQVFVSKDEFFGTRNLHDLDEFNLNLALKLATILLGLSRQDLTLGATLNHQTITVSL